MAVMDTGQLVSRLPMAVESSYMDMKEIKQPYVIPLESYVLSIEVATPGSIGEELEKQLATFDRHISDNCPNLDSTTILDVKKHLIAKSSQVQSVYAWYCKELTEFLELNNVQPPYISDKTISRSSVDHMLWGKRGDITQVKVSPQAVKHMETWANTVNGLVSRNSRIHSIITLLVDEYNFSTGDIKYGSGDASLSQKEAKLKFLYLQMDNGLISEVEKDSLVSLFKLSI